jgi:hypothetical protein
MEIELGVVKGDMKGLTVRTLRIGMRGRGEGSSRGRGKNALGSMLERMESRTIWALGKGGGEGRARGVPEEKLIESPFFGRAPAGPLQDYSRLYMLP